VLTLQERRTAIQQCRESAFSLAYIINGGGTMYSHGSARDTAAVEDFLAELASSLPLTEGEGDAKATQQIDNAMTFLKKLKVGDLGDAVANQEAQKNLKEEVERVIQHWEGLKFMISAVPATEAREDRHLHRQLPELAQGRVARLFGFQPRPEMAWACMTSLPLSTPSLLFQRSPC